MNTLPVEIVLHVMKFLKPLDVLCLNLSCIELSNVRPEYHEDPYVIGDVFRLKKDCDYGLLSKFGHIELVSKSSKIEDIMIGACTGGHRNIVKLLVDRGTTSRIKIEGSKAAIEFGHLGILFFLKCKPKQ